MLRVAPALALLVVSASVSLPLMAQETMTFDQPLCAGMSGLRAHWDQPIPVAENGERLLKDAVIKDRGQTAVWDGVKPGPLAFDAVHRSLLVRFPTAGQQLAVALAKGQTIAKVELVLPFLDEEIWPPGGQDFPRPDGYRYRTNWDCDKLYRTLRPNWHAVVQVLRQPWQPDTTTGPTYNAAIPGSIYWKRFGATDPAADRFPAVLGPVEVSSYHPEGRLDVTRVLTDAAYGKTLTERLQVLADCGFIINKQEVYDARYFQGAYEWAISTGPRGLLIKTPSLVVTFAPGQAEAVGPVTPVDVAGLAARHQAQPIGAPTAVVPSAAAVAALNERFMAKPAWMPDWQYAHVTQLMTLETGGRLQPFYYRVAPEYVIKDVLNKVQQKAGKGVAVPPADLDYAVYLAWLDWINGRPPRYWEGHLTAANNVTEWYNYRAAMPGPVQDAIIRCWTAWLMPDRASALDPTLRRTYDDVSGQLVHPMVDDPRVGKSKDGKPAEWNQGDTYYKLTGDWRGNKSYYRSGFTRDMSTANFNSSAASGALLNGQIIGSEVAMADGRAGLLQFPFWMWTHSAGVGQEYIDHYYWAIATAGNKLFPDFCTQPEDQLAGWSIIAKTVNDLAGGYHPNLKKLMGPASRTYYEHVLGQQDGLYHILHVLSPRGALTDADTGKLAPLATSAWGHDYPPAMVALQSMSGPWADPWFAELIDDKPLPWYALAEKKVVAEGDWVSTYFGVNYGLSSIRQTPQRIHVLGQWCRRAELPATMGDVGTLDLRIGFNQTQVANDGAGVISEQGQYRTYQHRNRLIMLARPQVATLVAQAAAHAFGQGKVPAQDITSVQCTAALFNYEAPAPTWEVFIDDTKVTSLPATAKYGQVITIHDGVSYLALRPLPTDDLGRQVEISLTTGVPQPEAYHEAIRLAPALLVNAHFYQQDTAIPAAALEQLKTANSGFVVELGDAAEYGTFAQFQAQVRAATLSTDQGRITYTSGKDTLVATWDGFTVNGTDPCAYAKTQGLWQDTTLTQLGQGRLEKGGAVIERTPGRGTLLLQTLPQQKIAVATNLLPTYQRYRFRTPAGVQIAADGACSMGRWMVQDARVIDLKYHAFGAPYAPTDQEPAAATALFISGTPAKPQVTLNGQDLSAALKPWQQDGAAGWLVSLTGTFLPDAELTARFAAQQAALPVAP